MTTVRSAVQQTVSRVVLRTLRERAQHVGLHSARSDAPQALAVLLDYHVPSLPALQSIASQIIAHGLGCIMVQPEDVAAWVDYVIGSGVRVGTYLSDIDDYAALEQMMYAGVNEIEVKLHAGAVDDIEACRTAIKTLRRRAADESITLKLDLTDQSFHDDLVVNLAACAATNQIDVVVIPEHLINVVQRSINSTTAIKVNNIATLEMARRVLAEGASRLGTTTAFELLNAARQS